MNTRHWIPLFLACLLVLTPACDDDDNTDSGDTQQPSDAAGDSTTLDDTGTTTDATSESDSSATDAAGDTTTGPPYTEYVFPACQSHTSTDDISPGLYTFTEACIATNPYAALTLVCPSSLLLDPPTPTTTARGELYIGDDGTFARNFFIDLSGTLYTDADCVADTLGGSCAEAENFIAALGGVASCMDDTDNGGCLCDVTGTAGFRSGGSWSGGAGVYTGELVSVAGDEFTLTLSVDDLDDGTVGTTDTATGDSQLFTFEGDGSICQQYCMYFEGVCRTQTGIDVYADYDDCMTQCATLPTTGEALPVSSGDSVECRATHARLAVDPANMGAARETHCPHAQFTATAPCN